MSQLFKLKNGTVLLSTEAPGGVYNSGQLKKIAELCSKELAVVKATEDQRLALFVKESEVEHVVQQLRAMGLGFRNYQEGLHQPVSCLGELCEEHEQPALSTALELTKAISTISLDAPLKIGINGCARCCTPCHTLDISILGEPSGYRISLGGKTAQFPELSSFFAEGVPAKELPRLVKSVISLYQSKAEPGESLNGVLERCGVEEFIQALSPYSQDAAGRDDPFAAADASGEEAATANPGGDEIALEDDIDLETDSNEDLQLEAGAEIDDLEGDADTSQELDELNFEDSEAESMNLDDVDVASADDVSLEVSEDLVDDDMDLAANEPMDTAGDSDELDLGDGEISFEESGEVDDLNLDQGPVEETSDELNLEDQPIDELDQEPQLIDEMIPEDDLAADDMLLDEEAPVAAEKPETPEDLDDLALGEIELEDDLNLEAGIPLEEEEAMAVGQASPQSERRLNQDLRLQRDDALSSQSDSVDELGEIPIDGSSADTLGDDLSLEDMQEPLAGGDLGAEDLEELELSDSSPASFSGQAPLPDSVSDDELDLETDEAFDIEADEIPPAATQELAEDELSDDLLLEDEVLEPELLEDELLESVPAAASDFASQSQHTLNFDQADDGEIPELDEELTPEALENTPMLGKASMAAALIPEDDFDEELTQADDILSSDEDENKFEAELGASIEEESRLLAAEEVDPNQSERQAALSLIENSEARPLRKDGRDETSAVRDLKASSPRVSKPVSSEGEGFRLAGVDFEQDSMRIKFQSGAYIDFDLSTLDIQEERCIDLGHQQLTVMATETGYFLEIDGMRMFHPRAGLQAAS